jgi:hypothetical protein
MERSISCPLCDETLAIEKNKKGRPYFKCLDCGFWGFVNAPKGIERLKSRCTNKPIKTKESWF